MRKDKNRDEAMRLVQNMAKNHTSDPYFYNRVMTHYRSGVLSIKDLREGTTQ